MATMVQELTKQMDKLTGKKKSLPDELARVREELDRARATLGDANLDGAATDAQRRKVADLAAKEAEFTAALGAADARLQGLGHDLAQAQREELIKWVQAEDARLVAEGVEILAGAYGMLDKLADMIKAYQALDYKLRTHPEIETGPLERHQVGSLCVELYKALDATVRAGVEIRFSFGGRPAAFRKLIEANRWKVR